MTPNEFLYWLHGWTELEQGKRPNIEQWRMIVSHLELVFEKVTPNTLEMEEMLDDFPIKWEAPIGPLPEDDTANELVDIVQHIRDNQEDDSKIFIPDQAMKPSYFPPDQGSLYCQEPATHYCDTVPLTNEGSQEPFEPTPPVIPRKARDD
jgi:hypothetical protein